MTDFPTTPPGVKGPKRLTIRARNIVGYTAAPFSGVQQVQEHQGKWWEWDITLPPMVEADGEQWATFFEELNGQVGTFLFGNPKAATPRGEAAIDDGDPKVAGAGQSGQTLDISTSLTDVVGYLKRGSMLSLGTGATRELYRVLRDVDLYAGDGSISIWPRLRRVPGNLDPVFLTNPTGLFRLMGNAPEHDVDEAGNYIFPVIPIIEALEFIE